MPKARILVIEDDRDLAEVLEYNLKRAGYEVFRSHDGRDGLQQAQLRLPDIVLLDVMLPLVDGLEICRQLRARPETRQCLIMMLTAKTEETDQLVGFSVGADDYVVKPFSVKVLLERVKALRRRFSQDKGADDEVTERGGLRVDRRRHEVRAGSRRIDLTRSEFKLLDTLIRQPGRVFDRGELIDAALGEDTLVLERTIDVHIRALRKKLGDVADRIQTVRGVGYRFAEPEGGAGDDSDSPSGTS
jgi:two-component system, OmpR family, phosphate regulon response regulator PhoB